MHAFSRPQSAALRIWHAAHGFVMLGLLATVLLRKTFLSWRTNSARIQEVLGDAGVEISAEVAKQAAVAIRAPMWDWHYTLGFALAALLVARVGIAIASPTERPMASAWRAVQAARGGSWHAAHFAVVRVSYVAVYALAAVMALSGLLLYFEGELGLDATAAGSIKDNHERLMWFFALFVPAHLAGVVFVELTGGAGIASAMIHGGRVP